MVALNLEKKEENEHFGTPQLPVNKSFLFLNDKTLSALASEFSLSLIQTLL